MSTALAEVWTAEQLMGLSAGEAVPEANGKGGKHPAKGKGVEQDPMLWGLPGHLTKEETDTFFKFQAEVEKRGGEFRDTVYCFGEIEGECWALTRWLRARKYVFEDVVKMVEEATSVRKDAKEKDFYPDPVDALGVDSSLFFAQYPQLYTGYSKKGVPVFISKPGILNVDGMECITTLDGIIKFHWHVMMHDFANRLRKQKEADPDKFKRFDCFCILDLNHLTGAQLSNRALAIIKEQSAIDSICFPETMHKMIIVNAPGFFAAFWRIIKGYLDPRTSNKIEVISSRAAGEKRLLELIDEDLLPSDYGGKGPDTDKTISEQIPGDAYKLDTRMMYVRGHGSEVIDVEGGQSLTVKVFTRSTAGAKFTIQDSNLKTDLCPAVEAKHSGTDDPNEMPSSQVLTPTRLVGPLKVKVKADSNTGRFSRQNFLIVFSFYKN